MKKLLFSMLLAALCFACTQQQPAAVKNDASPSTSGTSVAPTAVAAFACPMHPEVTGKEGDKCWKCKMDLKSASSNDAATHTCPMHPEITGKAGDKCPKCKMDLEPLKK